MRQARFLIGGLHFELEVDRQSNEFVIPPAYLPFQIEDGAADIAIIAHSGMPPEWDGDLLFDSNGPWKLWRRADKLLMTLHSTGRDQPYQVVFLEPDFTRGETYVDQEVIDGWEGYFPLNYPLDEVVAVNRLAIGRHGIEVHASGISDNGKGILFLGVSGSGKSTISRLWDAEDGVTVLSDDRIIITPGKDDGYWIHGTPWHGDAGLAAQAGVPLSAIFFISHAPENRAVSLGAIQGASQLLARSFPTFWHKEGMQFSAGLTVEIAQCLPCYQLQFLPERSAVEYVRNILRD